MEQVICRSAKQSEEIERLAGLVFHNEHGRKLLSLLVRARNPLGPRFNLSAPDPIAAAWRDGQADVISFLWRKGSDIRQLPEPDFEPQQHAKDDEN